MENYDHLCYEITRRLESSARRIDRSRRLIDVSRRTVAESIRIKEDGTEVSRRRRSRASGAPRGYRIAR